MSKKMIAKNISTTTQTQPLLLNVSNTVLHVTPEEFDSLCLDNSDLRLELSKDQELIVMSPQNVRSVRRLRRLAMRSHRAAVKVVKEIFVCQVKFGIGIDKLN